MIKRFFYWLFWKLYDSDIRAEDFDADETEGIFLEISMNDKFPDLLKAILKGDKTRYFRAQTEGLRNSIRGEYLRTLYLLRKIQPKKVKGSKVETKISGRYG